MKRTSIHRLVRFDALAKEFAQHVMRLTTFLSNSASTITSGLYRAAALVLLAICSAACHPDPESSSPTSHVDPSSALAGQGEAVAAELNRRYNDVRVKCGEDKPGYFCSGVIYRAIDWSERNYFWDNVQKDDYDGVSFSFARRDAGRRGSYRAQGYIFSAAEDWGVNGGYPLSMYCSFAFDGFTGPERGQHGCGRFLDWTGSEPCIDQGIDTVQKFAKHYYSHTGGERGPFQCSFGVAWQPFLLSILARQGGDMDGGSGDYTEQVISNWPHGIPSRLPMEAIYYLESSQPGALGLAQRLQQDFLSQTGKVLPIVRFNDKDMSRPPFSFDVADQGKPENVALKRPQGATPDGPGEPMNYHTNVSSIRGGRP